MEARNSELPMSPGDTFWAGVFGRRAPVEIEIGAGTGTFVLPTAGARPDTNFLAIEHARSRAAEIESQVQARALSNVIVLAADAACVVAAAVPEASVDTYHIYFPDPWWKRRHFRRRIFRPRFVADLARTLRPGGRLYVATDVPMVMDLIREAVASEPLFLLEPGLRSPRRNVTRFEHKGLVRGATILDAAWTRLPGPGDDVASIGTGPLEP